MKLVEKLANAKGITALLVVLILSVFVYFNLDFIYEITFKIDRTTSAPTTGQAKNSKSASSNELTDSRHLSAIRIESVELAPVDFTLPSYFYVALRNEGQIAAAAEVILDFGPSEVTNYEVRPSQDADLLSGGVGQNSLKLRFRDVSVGERVYVYALLTQPLFSNVVVNPIRGCCRNSMSYEEYRERDKGSAMLKDDSPSFGLIVLLVIGIVPLSILLFYLVYVIITLGNRVLGINSSKSS